MYQWADKGCQQSAVVQYLNSGSLDNSGISNLTSICDALLWINALYNVLLVLSLNRSSPWRKNILNNLPIERGRFYDWFTRI